MIARGTTFYPFDGGYSPTMVSSRFGDLIKIDSVSDTALPGAGTGWIQCAQFHDNPSLPVDRSHVISFFSYTLNLGDTPGTRDIASALRISPRDGTSALIWDGSLYRVAATSQGVQVTYVPGPATSSLLLLVAVATRRRARKQNIRLPQDALKQTPT